MSRRRFARYASCAREGKTSCARVSPRQRVRVCVTRSEERGEKVHGAKDACNLLRDTAEADRESFYAVYLDAKGEVAGIEEVSRGTATHVDVHPREVFKGALATNAVSILAAHNHPSGDPSPSADDIMLTRRLKEAGDLIGIPVVDHIVIGSNDRCVSIREERPGMFNGSPLFGTKK